MEIKWPELILKHGDLCIEIIQTNAEFDWVNANPPEDHALIDRPEGLARGFMDRGSYELPASLDTFRFIQPIFPGMARNSIARPLQFDNKIHIRYVWRGFS